MTTWGALHGRLTSAVYLLLSKRILSAALIVVAVMSRSSGGKKSSNMPFDSSSSSSLSFPFPLAGSFSRMMGGFGDGGFGEERRIRGRRSEIVCVGDIVAARSSGGVLPLRRC